MGHIERIVVDPEILVGKPCDRGTRLSVDLLVGLMAQGWPEAEILRNYPGLTREDLLACLKYASEILRQKKFIATRWRRNRTDWANHFAVVEPGRIRMRPLLPPPAASSPP